MENCTYTTMDMVNLLSLSIKQTYEFTVYLNKELEIIFKLLNKKTESYTKQISKSVTIKNLLGPFCYKWSLKTKNLAFRRF